MKTCKQKMKTDRELWASYCRRRFKCKPLIDDDNSIVELRVAYKIGYEDGKKNGGE